jgi:hypothetical protein
MLLPPSDGVDAYELLLLSPDELEVIEPERD